MLSPGSSATLPTNFSSHIPPGRWTFWPPRHDQETPLGIRISLVWPIGISRQSPSPEKKWQSLTRRKKDVAYHALPKPWCDPQAYHNNHHHRKKTAVAEKEEEGRCIPCTAQALAHPVFPKPVHDIKVKLIISRPFRLWIDTKLDTSLFFDVPDALA